MTKPSLSTLLFRGIKSVIALAGLLALLIISSNYCITRSIISDVYRDFYDYTDENPVDVLILGTSHAQLGINTLKLSRELDASVYTLAMPAQGIGQTYYTLKDALLHTKPKVVVIDSYFIDRPDILKDREYFAYEQMYAMDSWQVKAEYLRDMVPFLKWFTAVFPVINQHENWKNPAVMQQNFFYSLGVSSEKNKHINGFIPNVSVMSAETLDAIDKMDMEPLKPIPGEAGDYAAKIVDLCNAKGIKVVFVEVPLLPQYVAKVDNQTRVAELTALMRQLDTPFLRWSDEELGIGQESFVNESSNIGNNHLNINGANRYTARLGQAVRQLFEAELSQGSGIELLAPQQIVRFLESLESNELVVFSVNDDVAFQWLPEEIQLLEKLNLLKMPTSAVGQAYGAVFRGDGTVLWEAGQPERIEQEFKKGDTLNGVELPVNLTVISGGPSAPESHVRINGKDYAINLRGLNCVVYDLDKKKVTRAELFDMFGRSLYLKELMAE